MLSVGSTSLIHGMLAGLHSITVTFRQVPTKLRVGAFFAGRGIWETPIFPALCAIESVGLSIGSLSDVQLVTTHV